MSDITAIAGQVAGIVAFAAFVPYIFAILRGQTKPNRATWIIWTAVGFLLAVSYYSSGARHTIWVPVSYIIGPLVILLLSMKYGKDVWTWFDCCCLIGVASSLFFWWIFDSPLAALLINIFIDFLGALPTIRKVYYEPQSEDRLAWAMSAMAGVINLFAVEEWTFAISVYPIYIFCGNGLIVSLISIRRWQGEKAK